MNKTVLGFEKKIPFLFEHKQKKFFKKSLKMSPYDYLINYRINESMKLLKNSSLSILDISENVGFNNVSHYIQIFKKKTGQTPLEYRNSQ